MWIQYSAVCSLPIMAVVAVIIFESSSSSVASAAVVLSDFRTDWILSDVGQNCDTACVEIGKTCNEDKLSHVNSESRMKYVDFLITGDNRCDDYIQLGVFRNEPALTGEAPNTCVYLPPNQRADCAATHSVEYRFCCCGEFCPVEEFCVAPSV